MARPVKNTVDYFPHNCKHKQTMFIVEQNFGNNGYAFWFKLLELLGMTPGHSLDCKSLPTWKYILSYTHFSHDDAMAMLKLFVELNAIDKELWECNSIIWVQNFIDNIADVYSNRRQELPQKPNLNGSKQKIVSTDNISSNNDKIPVSTEDNNDKIPVSTEDNNDKIPVSTTETPQRKGKEIKVNNGESDVSTNRNPEDIKGFDGLLFDLKKINSDKDIIAYLEDTYYKLIKDMEPKDYGRMGKLFASANRNAEVILTQIWKLSCRTINGEKKRYLHTMVTGEMKKLNQNNGERKLSSSKDFRKEQGLDGH